VGKESARNEDETDKFISCRYHTVMPRTNGQAHNLQRHIKLVQTSQNGYEIFNSFLHTSVAGKRLFGLVTVYCKLLLSTC
jgi:hypothetical protein